MQAVRHGRGKKDLLDVLRRIRERSEYIDGCMMEGTPDAIWEELDNIFTASGAAHFGGTPGGDARSKRCARRRELLQERSRLRRARLDADEDRLRELEAELKTLSAELKAEHRGRRAAERNQLQEE
eukprot:6883507-Pyramimonas_sp.AAC.1